MPAFFDFHVHPTLKCLFSDPPQKLSPWNKIDIRLIPNLLRWCTEFEYILQSQASLTQLENNECNLVCIALYAPERALIDNSLILGEADGSLKVYLNKEKIEDMIQGRRQPYDLVVLDDLNTIFNAQQFGITDKKVVPLWHPEDYDPSDSSVIYAVFNVEGCHSFSSALNKFDINEIIAHLDDLRTRVPLLSVIITHMEQSPLCNHAFGIQFLNAESFRPTGLGISADGAQIIRHCYEHHIMVDIKHMSLAARQQLYRLRQTDSFAPVNQPIACTHAGFTGISVKDIPDYILDYRQYKSKGYTLLFNGKPVRYGRSRPAFNASSINLYDEDILEILRSGGMIGLSLDKRILGYTEPDQAQYAYQDQYPLDTEYVSAREQALFFSKEEVGAAFLDGRCITREEVEKAGPVNPLLGDYHLEHFMAHILHLIWVAEANGYDTEKALTQICIGSDFDGIINPVWICDTVDELVYFRERFEQCFPDFANESSDLVRLPPGFDISRFAGQLFFENGKQFVMERLRALAGTTVSAGGPVMSELGV